MSPLQPFVDWAHAVLDAADGGTYIPPAGTTLQFQTTLQPARSSNGDSLFQPAHFEPGDVGLLDLIATTVETEMDASTIEATIFAKSTLAIIRELESFEHWVEEPLNPEELFGMHTVLHNVLDRLAQNNERMQDVEKWPHDDDRVMVDKLLLAVAYVLSWQPYGNAMQFVWALAKPWYVRLSEVVSVHMENDDLAHLFKSLQCLKDRVLHFDNLLYGYLEGAGSLEVNEDMDADDDVDAVEMYHGVRVVRNNRGEVQDDGRDR